MTEKSGPVSLYVATIGVLSALMAVLSFASIVIPTPLGSYDSSSILIFTISILYGPGIGMTVTTIGQLVGKGLLITYSGLPAVYIPGVVAVRGVEAYIVGYLGRKAVLGQYRESIAMGLGVVWETFGFVIADIYLWSMVGGLITGLIAASFTIWTIVDLIWVPLGIAAVYYARTAFKTSYLDDDLRLVESATHRGMIYTCLALIIIAWCFIVLAGFWPRLMAPIFPLL